MIFDATNSPRLGYVYFRCALEDYDTDPVYEAFIMIEEEEEGSTINKDGEVTSVQIVITTWDRSLSQVPRWAKRLLSVLMPKIEEMLLTGKPQELRRWMDERVLEQIEKERAEN